MGMITQNISDTEACSKGSYEFQIYSCGIETQTGNKHKVGL